MGEAGPQPEASAGGKYANPGSVAAAALARTTQWILGSLLLLACANSESGKTPSKAATYQATSETAGLASKGPVSPGGRRKKPTRAPVTPGSAKNRPAHMLFGGDVSLGLGVGINIAKMRAGRPLPAGVGGGYPFTYVAPLLRQSDLAVVNLECVCSPLGKVATNHNPFRCPLETPDILKAAGVNLVSVANNHSMDFGPKALRDMVRRLDQAKLKHFGLESIMWRSPQPATVWRLGGLRVGLLAYYWPPTDPGRDLRAARRDVDFLVVFPHWGKEGEAEPLRLQRTLARAFVDAGADLVVGTHAHVVQPIEWYRGKLIAYGLGNMVFDGMNHTAAHREGQLLEVVLPSQPQKNPPRYRFHDIVLDREGQPRLKRTQAPLKPSSPRSLNEALLPASP